MHLPSDFHVTYLASVVFPRACATRSHPDLDPPQALALRGQSGDRFGPISSCVCAAHVHQEDHFHQVVVGLGGLPLRE